MQGQPKHYLFETETKRLKEYYTHSLNQLIDQRILFNNSIGTVRYVGELCHEGKPANSAGEIWVGLQWDENGRGKHNGTVNSYQYFNCPQKKGSLVKFEKIQFGYKLQTALFKRYFRVEQLHHAKSIYESLKAYKQEFKDHSEDEKNKKCEELVKKKIHKTEYDSEAYVETLNKQKKIMVEFIGFDEIWTKLNNLEKLQSISLAECRICDLGPKGHLSGILTNLKILSLEDNLISDWNQVFQLGLELRNLRQLSLSNNKIAAPKCQFSQLTNVQIQDHKNSYPLQGIRVFQNLQCLILINTGLTWKSLFQISQTFESTIQELIICRNDLSDIQNIDEEKAKKMKELVFLNVEETNQTTFEGIKKFKTLKNLEKLILNKNKIQALGKIQGFDNIKHLSVQYCDFNDPLIIYEISRFPEIQSLNIKHNPVGERMGNSHIRMRSVAELPKLKIINGAQLRKYERKDCEIYYLRETFKEYFTLKNVPDYDYDFDDFLKYCDVHHPGIQYFIKKYGNPYEVEHKKEIKEIVKDEVKQVQMKKGTGMIQLTLHNKTVDGVQLKKIPLTWTVNTLKNFFSKVYKIPIAMQIVTYRVDENSQEQQMTENHKLLSHYNLYEASHIYVAFA